MIYSVVLVSRVQHNDWVFLRIIFHYILLQDTGYNSLCCTINPCCLSILCIVYSVFFSSILLHHVIGSSQRNCICRPTAYHLCSVNFKRTLLSKEEKSVYDTIFNDKTGC